MPLTLSLLERPILQPVELSTAKRYLNLSGSNLEGIDTLISELLTTVVDYLQSITRKQFMTATWRYVLDTFPEGRIITLPKPPLQSVTFFKYYDTTNTLQTVGGTVYGIDSYSQPARIYLMPSASWPSTYDVPNAVQITMVTGWATVDEVPERLRTLILLILGDLYNHRASTSVEDFIQELPYVQRFVNSLRLIEMR